MKNEKKKIREKMVIFYFILFYSLCFVSNLPTHKKYINILSWLLKSVQYVVKIHVLQLIIIYVKENSDNGHIELFCFYCEKDNTSNLIGKGESSISKAPLHELHSQYLYLRTMTTSVPPSQ